MTSPPPALHTLRRESEVLGFIAIDSTVGGRARGGVRLVEDVSAEEIQAAARAMTLKYGFLGLPQGGAKAGIRARGEDDGDGRRPRLYEFAKAAEPLLRDRRFVPDADMGTTADDIRSMMQSVGLAGGPHDWRRNLSGHYTAVSCLASARAALAHMGTALKGCRVAIEGFGRVGSALAGLLHAQGALIVAVSTSHGARYDPRGLDIERLLQIAAPGDHAVIDGYTDAERLDRSALLELPVDLLCPCARYHGIHAGNASRIAARVVCAGANDPVAPEAERVLHARGIPYPPDFVTNCGGVLGGTLEFAGVRPAHISALIQRHVGGAVAVLVQRARQEGVPPRAVAEPLALARHQRVQWAAQRRGLRGRAFAFALEAYRRGWLPERVVGALAHRYMEAHLRSLA